VTRARPHRGPRAARTAPARVATPVVVTAVSLASVAVAAVATVAVGTVAAARLIVTPARGRDDDVRVLGVDEDAGTVTLASDADTRLPGRYSFWFDRGRGHARLGDVVSDDGRRVVRRLEAVTDGDLRTARAGRIGGWVHRDPAEAGLEARDVEVPTPLGPAPAWLVPADGDDEGRWIVAVHGRGVTRAETLRAVPAARRAGWTSLLVSWRNDGEAPRSADGRYGLGDDEWEDVEAAITWAVAHGATSVVLQGWSMGGATVLQAVTRASGRDHVVGVVLESPVVDWRETLRAQGDAMRVPGVVQRLVLGLLGSRRLVRLSGRRRPLDLDRLDLVTRADVLDVPVLLLHSDDDGFVPSGASHGLAAARPDLVRLEAWSVARHTKLWNLDPERFERVLVEWLDGLTLRPRRPSGAPAA